MPLRDIPSALWLWLPLPVVAAAVVLGFLSKNAYPVDAREWVAHQHLYHRWFSGESGVVEIGTVIVLIFAIIVGVPAARDAFAIGRPWIGRWLIALVAAAVYFAGEEISWGQQIFGWATPDWFAEINRQNETNLHNVKGYFNQKPRHLFMTWVIVGGIIAPAVVRRKRLVLDPETDWRYWFWPTWVGTTFAVIAILVRMPEVLVKELNVAADNMIRWVLLPTNGAEAQEYCYAVFLFLYLASIYYRLRQYRVNGLLDAALPA